MRCSTGCMSFPKPTQSAATSRRATRRGAILEARAEAPLLPAVAALLAAGSARLETAESPDAEVFIAAVLAANGAALLPAAVASASDVALLDRTVPADASALGAGKALPDAAPGPGASAWDVAGCVIARVLGAAAGFTSDARSEATLVGAEVGGSHIAVLTIRTGCGART